jgi:hypothetical protein
MSLLLIGGLLGGSQSLGARELAKAFYIFDIDDNLFRLPTKIILFEKGSGKEHPVSTQEYAEIRELVSKPGTVWENYEIRTDSGASSFRHFRPSPEGNYFLDDLMLAIKSGSDDWLGPSFDTFMRTLESPTLAQNVYFLTARGHDPEEVLEGIVYLLAHYTAKTGKKYYPPQLRNIHCNGRTPERKAEVLQEILLEINAVPFSPEAPRVLNAWGAKRELLHLVGFSDDDPFNRRVAEAEIAKFLPQTPNLKFTLWNSSQKPVYGEVLIPGGGKRRLLPEEAQEFVGACEDRLAI